MAARHNRLRQALAQEAARIMDEQGVQDFLLAKRKAAERLGSRDEAALPRNSEIEQALAERQRLFGAGSHGPRLLAQRRAALQAMRLLRDFSPRLVGPVLVGTATTTATIQLHVFSERAESVGLHLHERQIAYAMSEKRVRLDNERTANLPCVCLTSDAEAVEAIVFPLDGIRQAPLSPVDARPMRRADQLEVAALVTGAGQPAG